MVRVGVVFFYFVFGPEVVYLAHSHPVSISVMLLIHQRIVATPFIVPPLVSGLRGDRALSGLSRSTLQLSDLRMESDRIKVFALFINDVCIINHCLILIKSILIEMMQYIK